MKASIRRHTHTSNATKVQTHAHTRRDHPNCMSAHSPLHEYKLDAVDLGDALRTLSLDDDDTSDDTSDEPAASDERRHQVPQQLPAAVLQALDGMLRIDPDHRISATDVVSLLRADPCHSEC